MNTLKETQYELRQLRSGDTFGFGLHLGEELAVGEPGIPVSETPLDPSRHPVSAADPNALMATLEGPKGRLWVTEVIPFRKLPMNVIIHNDVTAERMRRMPQYVRPILDRQLILADSLRAALDDCAQFGDEINTVVIGADNPYKDRRDIRFERARTNARFADKASQIAADGLSFVISTFHDVPLRKLKVVAKESPIIAVKANHHMHIALPANCGELPVDDGRMIDTDDPKELGRYNAAVAANHEDLERTLIKRRSGMALAKVVYDPKLKYGYDVAAADKSLAAAVRSLS